ncbi:MAG: DUF1893 domain-containing protein [Candidatus Nealsonbacteria bacterium]
MKKQFERFLSSSFGLEVWSERKLVFKSKKSGVKGLLDFIKKHGRRYKEIVIFDKIVGQGVALLAAYLRALEVFGKTGSKLAAKSLRKHKIKFYFKKTVENILNKENTDLCPLEKISFKKSPEEFYKILKK